MMLFSETGTTTGRTCKRRDDCRRPCLMQPMFSFCCVIFEIPVTQSSDNADRQLDIQIGSSRLEIDILNLAA